MVDDHEPSRRLLEDVLGSAGYRVMSASTGAAAIEWAKRLHPKLVILDLALPDLSGLYISKLLRSQSETASVSIIAVTARPIPGVGRAAIGNGSDAYLAKPIRLGDLTLMVSTLLSRHIPPEDRMLLAGILPSGAIRWTARRKALLIIAIRNGMITPTAASERFAFAEDELSQWQQAFDRHGVDGLLATKPRRRSRSD